MITYWFVTFEIVSGWHPIGVETPTFGVITFDGWYNGAFSIDRALQRIKQQYGNDNTNFQIKSFQEISFATYDANDKYLIR